MATIGAHSLKDGMASDGSSARELPTSSRVLLFGLAVVLVLAYVAPLDIRPVASPDEVRYGAIAHEMLATGDWTSPRFNGVRYFEKPILGYWIDAISFEALGENPFALRLPVVIATFLTALVVFRMARRYVSASGAMLAGGIYLTTLIVAAVGTFAVLDAFLALFLTAAIAAWYVAINEPPGLNRALYLAGCGAACGAAFLTKGFIALAVPVIVAAPHLIARRRWRTLVTAPWIPIAVAAAVALPWAIAIHLREPDFWHYFFWIEHVQRFAGADAQHARPPWFYAQYLPLLGWPWVLFLPAALVGLSLRSRTDFLRYAALWAVMPALFFSISRGKLLTYVLPCFAPLAILLATGLERYLRAPTHRAFRGAAALVCGLLLLAALAVGAAQTGAFGAPIYDDGEVPQLGAMVCLLLGGAAFAAYSFRDARPKRRLAAVGAAGAALVLAVQFALPRRFLDEVAPADVVRSFARATPGDAIVVSDASLFGTVAWALGRNDVYVVSPGEIEYGLSYPQDRHRQLDAETLARLVAENREARQILVVCKDDTLQQIERALPPAVDRAQSGHVVLLRIRSKG